MIANKTKQMTEILSFDSALLSPADQSFFSDDCLQSQHCSEITSLSSDEWLQGFDDIRSFCDGLDLNFNNEPELTLEAMNKEVDTQYQTKANEIIDDLYSSAFMSPLSLEPSSPQAIDGSPAEHELDSGVDSTALSLLEEILSANSSDSESFEDQCFESELSLQFITEVSKDSEMSEEMSTQRAPKRQYKRKSQTNDKIVKTNKRSKTVTERRERKRNQNKSAANRYRQKKRAELDVIESEQNNYEEHNNQLKAQLQKLQMEFKVVYPLAKAAFATDPKKALLLQMLDIRVLNQNLLE